MPAINVRDLCTDEAGQGDGCSRSGKMGNYRVVLLYATINCRSQLCDSGVGGKIVGLQLRKGRRARIPREHLHINSMRSKLS